MFSNVNQVVNACYLVTIGELDPFYVNGDDFACYRPPGYEGNPWELYFEQPFPDAERTDDPIPMMKTVNTFLTPYDASTTLLAPTNRAEAQIIIENYLHRTPLVIEKTEELCKRHWPEEKIACLIRGPGKLADCNAAPQRLHESKYGSLDYRDPFIAEVKKHFKKTILYSDATDVLIYARKKLGKLVEWTDEPRRPRGELHHGHHEIQQDLGVYIIAEAYMMAASLFYVYGSSNISNFVLGLSPTLGGVDIYER